MTGPQAAKQAGITYRQLDHWCRQGWISEAKTDPHGHGNQRTFTRTEMTRLTHLARLVRLGITPPRAVELLTDASALKTDEPLVIDRDGIRLILDTTDAA